MKNHALLIGLLVYGFFSLTTLFLWQAKGINTVTGDEPHYLVMASGIVRYGSLEQTEPYREEFRTREIYKHGLAPEDAQPSPDNTQAVLGPNGLFNVHNIGLPLLLALPFMAGGVVGAKLLMIFLGALVVVAAWKFSFHFSGNESHRLWAIIAATIAVPLVPASNQIYPEVVAGLLALTGLYWFFTTHQRRGAGLEVLLAATIAFLPWLQIKFAATCVVLVLSVVARIYLQSRDFKRILRILIVAGTSCLALAAYNHYAFGRIYGPYHSGALELNKTSLMVLFGLHIDQNQGFILQNPINLIGVLAIGWLYKFNRAFVLVWLLVFLSLIVPNALHPNWYGGGSFSGRFQWAAAMVFAVPTIYGLLVIGESGKRLFKVIIATSVLLQVFFFFKYAVEGVNLYNKDAGTWFDAYSIFYFPLHGWMPMLYNSAWAYGYLPNYAWVILTFALLFAGFLNRDVIFRKARFALGVLLILIFSAGLSGSHGKDKAIFQAAQLPSRTGRVVNSDRVVDPDVDRPGFVNYGPYFPLRRGSYKVVLSYKSSAGASSIVGWVDVFDSSRGRWIVQIPLRGTDNANGQLAIQFKLNQWKKKPFEFRTYWNGVSNLDVRDIVLTKE